MTKQDLIQLVFVSGPDHRAPEQISGRAPCTLGRGSTCDIILEDSAGSISRRHLEILHRDGSWFAMDLGSRNGSFLNANRLPSKQPVELHNASVLQIGAWAMR
ncbi:unnamed protein product, partial [Laminaria digitata]